MKKLYLLILILSTSLSGSFLSAKEEEEGFFEQCFEAARRAYRDEHCDYKEKCAVHCVQNKKLPAQCDAPVKYYDDSLYADSKLYPAFIGIMVMFHQISSDEAACKYGKKCHQYGYCPSGDCAHSLTDEELNKILDEL